MGYEMIEMCAIYMQLHTLVMHKHTLAVHLFHTNKHLKPFILTELADWAPTFLQCSRTNPSIATRPSVFGGRAMRA